MLTLNLNLSAVLETYCFSHRISDQELDFLERSWFESLNSIHYNRFPNIAPSMVCDFAGVERGSYWIICNAAILDEIRPFDSGKSRRARLFDVLAECGLSPVGLK